MCAYLQIIHIKEKTKLKKVTLFIFEFLVCCSCHIQCHIIYIENPGRIIIHPSTGYYHLVYIDMRSSQISVLHV